MSIKLRNTTRSLYNSLMIFRHLEKHKQEIQTWETKYDILKKRYVTYTCLLYIIVVFFPF